MLVVILMTDNFFNKLPGRYLVHYYKVYCIVLFCVKKIGKNKKKVTEK